MSLLGPEFYHAFFFGSLVRGLFAAAVRKVHLKFHVRSIGGNTALWGRSAFVLNLEMAAQVPP